MANVHEHIPMSKKRVHDLPTVTGSLAIDATTEVERLKAWLDAKLAQGRKDVVSEVVTLTPALAKLLLERNHANRPLSDVNLDRMRKDIRDGNFVLNGEPIILSRDGLLNDGQHRCHAVIQTSQSIRTVIVFGPERDSRFTVDQGNVRTIGNYLSMKGSSDANVLGAVATYIWMHRHLGQLEGGGKNRPTKTQILELMSAHDDIHNSVAFVSRPRVSLICTKSTLAFAHWSIAHAATLSAADGFMDKLITGANLAAGDPVLYCKNRLPEIKARGDTGEKAELIFRAWNFYRRGERVDRINIMGKKLPKLEG